MIARCAEALRRGLLAADELVVVDSASRDAQAVAAAATAAGARLVRCERPGVDRARNAGWRTTHAPLVLFTDDDVVVDTAWADAFAAAAGEHPEADFFTGRIDAPPGQDTRWEVALLDDERPRLVDRGSRGVLGHGASLAVRRAALERIGGWDEALGAGARFASAPEVDLFDRLLAAGSVGWYTPSARAWHDQWRTTRDIFPLHFRYGTGNGARIAKLLRTDRRRAATVAWECLWPWGLQSLLRRIRHLDKAGTLVDLVRMCGYVAGFVRGLAAPVDDGHFRPR